MPTISSISPPIAFNTTSVSTLDSVGKLYKTAAPLTEAAANSPAQEALVYSLTSVVAEGKALPAGAKYLTNSDDTYFSIQDISSKRLSLVVAGNDLNLFTYTPPTNLNGTESGSINKYVFDGATGILKAGAPANPISITNALDIGAAELAASRDLDGNGGIGGSVNLATDTLDKANNFYKIKVAAQDMYIVNVPFGKTASAINLSTSVLLNENGDGPWAPQEQFSSFSVIKGGTVSSPTWDIYARKVGTGNITEVTKFSFDSSRKLQSGFSEGKLLTAQELASIEKTSGVNLNADSVIGATIKSVDTAGGLYKGTLLSKDFYIVAPGTSTLKTGTTQATATDLSGALMDGNDAWAMTESKIKSIVQKTVGLKDIVEVYVKDSPSAELQRFNFEKNASGNYDLTNTGDSVDSVELAKQEKAKQRDLNGDGIFGIKVNNALDSVGGLFIAEALDVKFLVAAKSLVSNSKTVADLSAALTNADGSAWIPSEISATNELTTASPSVRLNINVSSATAAEVYVKNGSEFSKYSFTKSGDSPWVVSGTAEPMRSQEMVALEKSLKRDFNNDSFIGAEVYGTPIASGLYTARYGRAAGDLGVANGPIYIYSDTKLSLGNTVGANAKDFTSALKFSDGNYWKPAEGYTIKGAYVENGKYNIIATTGTRPITTSSPSTASDYFVQRYTFNLSTKELDDTASTDIDAKELARVEKLQKADLNGDGITGVKVLNTEIDRVGLLFKVEAYDGIYFSTKGSATEKIDSLDKAFLSADGLAWEPEAYTASTKLTLRTLATPANGTKYEIYRSEGTLGNRTFSKYSFGSDMKMIGSASTLSLLEMANAEDLTSRDINGDKVIGAKVDKVVDKTSGLYQVSIEDKKMLVQSQGAVLKTTTLANVLLGEDSQPLLLNANGKLVDDGLEYNVDSLYKNGSDTLQVFTSRSTGTDTFEFKQFKFDKKTDGDFTNYFSLSKASVLNAKELIDLEKASGKDINFDKSIGAKISTFSNDKSGQLYSAKILGQDYYFFDTKGQKIGATVGTNSSNAIDLSKAFLDANGSAWAPPAKTNNENWNIAGVVENKNGTTTTGYDIFVYQKAATVGDFNVKKFSWDENFVYQDENAVDAAALVKLEVAEKRDFSGDGIVGFKIDLTPPAYPGVTRAKVMGGSTEDKFYVVGDFSKQIKQFGLPDALLNSAGTGAWLLDENKFSITGVKDVPGVTPGTGDRFVYAKSKTPSDSSITRFTFNLSNGKYVSEAKLSDAQFAEEEKKFNKDLNNDKKIGVLTVQNILVDAKVATANGSLMNEGNTGNKSTGLTKANINSIDYLLVRDTPNATATTTLSKALMLEDGVTAWKPDTDFYIKGVFNPGSGDTEIYGTIGSTTGALRKYVFESVEMPNVGVAPLSLTGTLPTVLKLKAVGGSAYSTVTQKDIAIKEATAGVGKDLNGDGVIGFKVNTLAASKVSIADGTTLAKTLVDEIYVLGKQTDKFGNSSTNTANSNALVEDADADVATPNTFWKPQDGYQVKSINKISETEVHVYAANTTDSDSLIQYKFEKPNGSTSGWKLKEASTTLDTEALIALEVSLRRNMNADSTGTIGLKYSNQINGSGSNLVPGLISGSIGTKKYLFVGQEMQALGTTAKPFGLQNVAGANLLKKSDGSAWVLPPSDTNINSFRTATTNDISGVPTSIKASDVRYTMEMNNSGKIYFDSTYKQLEPMLTKGTFSVITKDVAENGRGGFFVPESFATAADSGALTFSATYKKTGPGTGTTYSAVTSFGAAKTDWLQFDATSKMFSVKNPENDVVGTYDIRVRATDAQGRYVEDQVFTLNINNTNDTPEASATAFTEMVATIGQPLTSYVIPMTLANPSFKDVDVDDTLTFTAGKVNGTAIDALPDWLEFDANSMTLRAKSGVTAVPTDAAALTVRITATDISLKSAHKDISIVINQQPFIVEDSSHVSTLVNKVATVGTPFTYNVSAMFDDPDTNKTLSFVAKKLSGGLLSDLPSWLRFDSTTQIFSSVSNVPSNAETTRIKVTATDSKGSSIDGEFEITANRAPVSVVKLDNKFFDAIPTGGVDGKFDITTDLVGAFVDPDPVDSTLQYSFKISKDGGTPADSVPNELTRSGNKFTYTDAASGTYKIDVTAKDTRNISVTSSFEVTIGT